MMHFICTFLKKNVCVNSSADDELRNIRCREARRDRYANMPLDKMAELNARRRSNQEVRSKNHACSNWHVCSRKKIDKDNL